MFHLRISMQLPNETTTLDIASGEIWNNLRKNLTPTFTSGKLKAMMEPMAGVGDDMIAHFEKLLKNGPKINCRDTLRCFSLNSIMRCAFGLEANAHENPEQDLIRYTCGMMRDIRVSTWMETLMEQLFLHFPFISRVIRTQPPAAFKIFYALREIIAQREKSGVEGSDFLARLIKIKADLKVR